METKYNHICPWWLGPVLASPIRKLFHNPVNMLKPFINQGMRVVDYGCAMGFFTLPMARLVGESGQVFAIDIQKKMIDGLYRRATKARLEEIIFPILITENTDFEELSSKIDFALLFAMVHEVPDKGELFNAISKMVKPGGTVLFAEPKGHVSREEFEKSIGIAFAVGFRVETPVLIKKSHAVILTRI